MGFISFQDIDVSFTLKSRIVNEQITIHNELFKFDAGCSFNPHMVRETGRIVFISGTLDKDSRQAIG
jgi:hypothetical protein